jgi:hypothetical protein
MKTYTNDSDWQKNIWAAAKTYGLTTRSLSTFEATSPILTQELFTIAVRAADWAEKTGGCTPRASACLADYAKTLTLAVITQVPEKTAIEGGGQAPQDAQQPGTFSHLYDTESHVVYTYILKSGGTPAGVRQQYLNMVDRSELGSRITVRNIGGEAYSENYFILAGQSVFVHVQKPNRVVITPETSPTPVEEVSVPAADVPGTFVFDSETDTVTLYRYTVRLGGNVGGVRNAFKTSLKLTSDQTFVVTDEAGRELSNSTTVVKNQRVFVRLQKSVQVPEALANPTVKPEAGLFTLFSEQEGLTIYTYTVKSGGNPGWVRNQYLKTHPTTAKGNIRITDAEGKVYFQETYFVPGTLVYVRVAQ